MEDDSSQRARPRGPSTAAPRQPETALAGDEIEHRPPSRHAAEERTNGSDRAPEATAVRPARDDALDLEGAPATDTGPIRVLGGGSDFGFDGVTLEQALADVDARSAPARPRARALPALPRIQLDERLGRILLSIVLAFLLWFYVQSLENPTRSTRFADLTVDVRGLTKDMKLTNSLPTVSAFVQAPQDVLSRLGRGDVHPYVDVTGLQEGTHDVPVQVEVGGGRGSEVEVSLSPQSVQVQLGLQATRDFNVSVEVIGTPPLGYDKGTAQVSPATVTATGLKSDIDKVASVKVRVNIEGRADTQQGIRAPLALDAAGSEIKGITFTPSTVQVVVPINLLLNYKVVPVRVPLQGQPAAGYGVSLIGIDPTNVAACCEPSVLSSLSYLETRPVSITGITSTMTTHAELVLPPNVKLSPGQPSSISVTVQVTAQQTTQDSSVEVSISGLGDGLSAVVAPIRMDVVLGGTLNELQNLSPTGVRAVVNADGRGPGTYNIKPTVIVPQGVKIQSTTPATVTLTIIAPTPVPTQTPNPTATRRPQPTQPPTAVPPTPSPAATHANPTPTAPTAPPPATPTGAGGLSITPAVPATPSGTLTHTPQEVPEGAP